MGPPTYADSPCVVAREIAPPRRNGRELICAFPATELFEPSFTFVETLDSTDETPARHSDRAWRSAMLDRSKPLIVGRAHVPESGGVVVGEPAS